MPKIGATKKSEPRQTSEQAPAWFQEYKSQQEATINRLEAELKAAKAQPVVTQRGGRVYAPATTTPEQARSLSMENLRDLGHLMVKVIPGSPKTKAQPYGQPVLVGAKNNPNVKMVAIKDGLDRGDYIKLRDMVQQMSGDFWSYREPQPLSDEQISGVLCPLLDRLGPEGAELFSW